MEELKDLATKNNVNLDYSKTDITVEFVDLINGMLQFDPKKRLDWNDVLSHPFLNTPINKQLRFTDLLFHLSENNNKDSFILTKLKKLGKNEYGGIVMSINEHFNFLALAKSKGLISEVQEDHHLQLRFTLENNIVDYIKTDTLDNKRKRCDSEELDKLFDAYDVVEEFYFVFEEIENGYVLVEQIKRKLSSEQN